MTLRCELSAILPLLFCLVASSAEPQRINADAELAAAKAAREKGNSDEAFYHVDRALAVDPNLIEAHFVLAATADDGCHPNAQPGPDVRLCELAFREYAKVLELDQNHQNALISLADLSYEFDRLDDAESNYRKALIVNPNDPEALCGVAAMDLRRSWPDLASITNGEINQQRRARFINLPKCIDARRRNQARIDEGIELITGALHVRNNDINLLGYLAAFYWLRGEIQCGNQRANSADRTTAKRLDRMRYERWKQRAQSDWLQKCPPAPNPLTRWK
jgi:tetratricopeptide (TPR) repeat protein